MTMPQFRRRRRGPAPTTDARPVDERLEALVRESNPDRRDRMMQRIRAGIESAPDTVTAWIRAARVLADRLIIGEDAFHYFANIFAESVMIEASGTDAELVRLYAEIEAIERANGLAEDESYDANDAPEDWLALNAKWEARFDTILADAIRASGFADVADLLLLRRAEFDARCERGHSEIWGDDDGLDDDDW
jgi:hypothetical protein